MISKGGGKYIAQMLAINQHLQKLRIIGELELEDICEGLIKNHSLTTLDIGFNNIGNEEAKHLAKMLKVNETLTHLHLSNKYII